MQLICKYLCFSSPSSLKTNINLVLVDTSSQNYANSCIFFIIEDWLSFLKHHPNWKNFYLVILLRHIELVWYKKPKVYIFSLHLTLVLFDLEKIDNNLKDNQVILHISQVVVINIIFAFFLGKVPKSKIKFWKILHFLFLSDFIVNNWFCIGVYLFYAGQDNFLYKDVEAKDQQGVINHYMQNIFPNILMA